MSERKVGDTEGIEEAIRRNGEPTTLSGNGQTGPKPNLGDLGQWRSYWMFHVCRSIKGLNEVGQERKVVHLLFEESTCQ